jgi:putative sigma-54 modulation protein
MELDIRTEGVASTEALRTFIERRIRMRLDRFANRIRRIFVLLQDENGPRGGRDKLCRVHVELADGERVVRESKEASVYVACCSGLGRAQRAVAGRLNRAKRRFSGFRSREKLS